MQRACVGQFRIVEFFRFGNIEGSLAGAEFFAYGIEVNRAPC